MNGEKLLKFVISFLIVLQVIGFAFRNDLLFTFSKITLPVSMIVLYFVSTKRVRFLHVIVLFIFLVEELVIFFVIENPIKYRLFSHIIGYTLLLYFLYYNHKSFKYNKRDVFTLVLGSTLYTVIFFATYFSIHKEMNDLSLLGFLNLLLLYILLIVGAMHYINIRSEKSLWFFLSMLNYTFSDFMLLLDRFYLQSYELRMLMLICKPMAMVFLVNYMVTKFLKLKSGEFEGF